MPVPAFRNSRGRVRRRRSHHALTAVQTSVCANCQAPILAHQACTSCGFYKGRNVIQDEKAVEKTLEKVVKAKKVAKKPVAEAADAQK